MPLLETPFARLDLIRQPEQQNEPLQAFDAADEYLLNFLAEQQPSLDTRVLVLNDSFGALAASLVGNVQVTSSGDSFLAFQGLEKTWPVTTWRSMPCRRFLPVKASPGRSTGY